MKRRERLVRRLTERMPPYVGVHSADWFERLLSEEPRACSCDFPAHGHALGCPLRPDVATERLRIVRAVVEHWHNDAVSHLDDPLKAHYTVAGHALSCVLAALDGKTAAGDLGMPEGWKA